MRIRSAGYRIWGGFVGSLAALILTGCTGLPGLLSTPTFLPTRIPTLIIATLTPVVTGSPSDPSACAYVWSNKELPEVALQVSQAYRMTNITNVDVRAAAYGENCIDTNTNNVVSFSAMQTDFYLTVPVQDGHDTQALGDWIARLVPVIAQLPAGTLPGPNPGSIAIQFKSSAGDTNIWFPRQTAQDLIQKGIGGSALYQALAESGSP